MSAWFGSSTPRVAQDPQPPPESDAPTHPNEPAWELVEALEARVKQHDGATPFVVGSRFSKNHPAAARNDVGVLRRLGHGGWNG